MVTKQPSDKKILNYICLLLLTSFLDLFGTDPLRFIESIRSRILRRFYELLRKIGMGKMFI